MNIDSTTSLPLAGIYPGSNELILGPGYDCTFITGPNFQLDIKQAKNGYIVNYNGQNYVFMTEEELGLFFAEKVQEMFGAGQK